MHELRSLRPEEAEAWGNLYAEAFAAPPWNEECDPAKTATYIARFMERPPLFAYGFFADGRPAALAVGEYVPCPEQDMMRIEDFCVGREHQGKGIGGAFLAALKQEGVRHGCDCMMLATMRGYPAHRFYEKNGFVPLNDSVLLYQDL